MSNSPPKGQRVSYFRLSRGEVSAATTPRCHCSMKSAINNMQTNGHGCAPTKCYLQNQNVGHVSIPGLMHKKGKRSDETAEARGLNDITQEACQSKEKNC